MAFANESGRRADALTEDFSATVYAALQRLNAVMQRVNDYRAFRKTMDELSELSNADLADLGLHRSEIRRVALESVYGLRP